MCGFAGIIGFNPLEINSLVLQNVSDTLKNRGPDDLGFLSWSDALPVEILQYPKTIQGKQITLIHRRLSIIDLSIAGRQPMRTDDGRYHIVFNGEIYNYLELQTQLKALGHQFSSHSDTEVLLAAYSEWGSKALSYLVGMFAFAILDTWEQKIFLARDFFGIKPLYYTYWEGGLAFASEIKALLQLPGVSRQVNPRRLYDYLHSGLTDYGGETLFADIRQLPPAHFLKVSLDTLEHPQIERYWQIEFSDRTELSFSEAASELRQLFLQNIRLHLRSDVPVGAALSGGIDSSAIVMAMRHLQGENLELHTFSYIAEDSGLSEEKWVDIVAQQAAAIKHKVQPLPGELVADLNRLVDLQDEPFSSTSMYVQYRVFQMAKAAGIKVMLDGQGADEILGGYRPYIGVRLASLVRQGKWKNASQLLQKASRLPGSSQKSLLMRTARFLLPPSLQAPLRQLIKKDISPSWLNANWFTQNGVALHPLSHPHSSEELLREQLYYACVENSLPMLLRYEDRNSMAHSIESRVPFLTPALVNFVFSLPEEFIIANDGTSKAIFRQAMRGIVPDPILDRKDKIGFATPEQQWLTTLRPWVEQVLQSDVASEIPALNLKQIKAQCYAILEGRASFDFYLWRWMNLIRWAENFNVVFE
ncbi:MAG: asparagine synthase (glutamine-hydrolyzing) [Mastigocoleus sp. MO_167.B18]|nr:asparagine synthase (glutamine-hydrolyzing) [Mastigocoleus sp. MO_167.B18]